MRNSKKNNITLIPISGLLAAAVLMACSAQSESDQPGSCTLKCSNPRVGSSDYEVIPLMPEGMQSLNIQCNENFATAGAAALARREGPIQVKYLVYEKAKNYGDDILSKTPDSNTPNVNDGGTLSRVPRGGIGFEPWLYGGMAADKTNPELLGPDLKTITQIKYAGVVTPKGEWCSDTCGVMTYEFWPLCIAGKENQITAGVAVHGAISKSFTTFNVVNEQ